MGGEEECQKRTNNGLALSLSYVQSARPIVRAPSLFPFIVLVCQPHRTTVQTEKRREKEER
jgi:hypothetical protein